MTHETGNTFYGITLEVIVVGKLIYWRFRKFMLTLTKVSKGGVMALHRRVSIIHILASRK